MTCNLHFLNHDIKYYFHFPDMTLQIIFLPSVMTLVIYLPKHDITNDLPFSKHDITNDLPVPKHDIINTDNLPFPKHDITYNIGSSRQQQGFDSDGSFITVLQGFRHYIYFFKNLLFQRFLTNTKIPECLESKPT